MKREIYIFLIQRELILLWDIREPWKFGNTRKDTEWSMNCPWNSICTE